MPTYKRATNLVVGKEYILTHVGCEPGSDKCTPIIHPPGAGVDLLNAYKTWRRLTYLPAKTTIEPIHYLKRAYYAGDNASGDVFIQPHTVTSKAKPFKPVDLSLRSIRYIEPTHYHPRGQYKHDFTYYGDANWIPWIESNDAAQGSSSRRSSRKSSRSSSRKSSSRKSKN